MSESNPNLRNDTLLVFKEKSILFHAMICSCIDYFESSHNTDKLNHNLKKTLKSIKNIILEFKQKEELAKIENARSHLNPRKSIAPEQISDLVHKEPNVEECAICLDDIDRDHAQARLSCKHVFHLCCAGSAFNNSEYMRCPICRCCQEKAPSKWIKPKIPLAGGSTSTLQTPLDYESRAEFDYNAYSSRSYVIHSPQLNSRRRDSSRRNHEHIRGGLNLSEFDGFGRNDLLYHEVDNLEEVSQRLSNLGHEITETGHYSSRSIIEDYMHDQDENTGSYESTNDVGISESSHHSTYTSQANTPNTYRTSQANSPNTYGNTSSIRYLSRDTSYIRSSSDNESYSSNNQRANTHGSVTSFFNNRPGIEEYFQNLEAEQSQDEMSCDSAYIDNQDSERDSYHANLDYYSDELYGNNSSNWNESEDDI